MKIEIWSDVVCPWCYIGKRRLETALAEYENADDVEIVWRSFQLDPGAPAHATESTTAMLARRYGQTPQGARQMQDQVEAVAADEGLILRTADTLHLNTFDAHRLLHLAQQGGGGRQGALKEALLAAYFTHGADLSDHGVLTSIAVAAGLDAGRVEEVLAGSEFTEAVHADIAAAQAYGAGGVPFVVVDGRYGISGAQPAAVFAEALRRARAEVGADATGNVLPEQPARQ